MDDSQGDSVDTGSNPSVEQTQTDTASQAQTNNAQQAAPAAEPQKDEVADHKLYAILGYILPFLFFLPLISDSSKNNPFARFHANQQLLLLLVVAGLYLIHNVLYIVFMAGGYFIIQILNLLVLVLVIMGVINAAQGNMKELPVIGKFRLLK